jgi:hypothetical protein
MTRGARMERPVTQEGSSALPMLSPLDLCQLTGTPMPPHATCLERRCRAVPRG